MTDEQRDRAIAHIMMARLNGNVELGLTGLFAFCVVCKVVMENVFTCDRCWDGFRLQHLNSDGVFRAERPFRFTIPSDLSVEMLEEVYRGLA